MIKNLKNFANIPGQIKFLLVKNSHIKRILKFLSAFYHWIWQNVKEKKVTNSEVDSNLITVTMCSVIETVVINKAITALLPFFKPYCNLKCSAYISNHHNWYKSINFQIKNITVPQKLSVILWIPITNRSRILVSREN